jgi:kynureninase
VASLVISVRRTSCAFGITPLYLSEDDIDRAVEIIADVMTNRLWDDPSIQKTRRRHVS